MTIKAVTCDFGGVLTAPPVKAWQAVESELGISRESFERAMQAEPLALGRTRC
jgi:hypothetical protein